MSYYYYQLLYWIMKYGWIFFAQIMLVIYLYIDKYIILNFYNISGQTSPMTGPTPLTHPPNILIWSMTVSYTHLTLPTNREV